MTDEEEYKPKWRSEIRCPNCERYMRHLGSSFTPKFYYTQVICGHCGVFRKFKIPVAEYQKMMSEKTAPPRARRTEEPTESIGRRIYGDRKARQMARRIKDDEDA